LQGACHQQPTLGDAAAATVLILEVERELGGVLATSEPDATSRTKASAALSAS